MIPKDRVLDKLDSLLQSNDYAGAKRMLQYWLSEAEYTGDDQGVLLMQNELMGLCRKLGEKEKALKYAQDALDQLPAYGWEIVFFFIRQKSAGTHALHETTPLFSH